MAKRVIAAVLGLLLAQPAWAEWVKLGTEKRSRDTYYWDPATVRKTANGRRAWVMMDFGKPQKSFTGIPYKSDQTLYEYNCAEEASRRLQIRVFAGQQGDGNVIDTVDKAGTWSVVGPGSIGEDILKTVCSVPLQ